MEFSNLRLRLMVFSLLARLLPDGRATSLRTALIRGIGLQIGPGTRFLGMPMIQSTPPGSLRGRLRIGSDCVIGKGVVLEFGEHLSIGDRVTLADRATVITTTHDIGPREQRCGPPVRRPVTIEDEAVIGESAVILPGTTIGRAAQVLPGSVVNAPVPTGGVVAGIPAKPVAPGG
jgi:maltose O-acetyltransferase